MATVRVSNLQLLRFAEREQENFAQQLAGVQIVTGVN